MSARPAPPPDGLPSRLVTGSVLSFWAGFVVLMSVRAAALGFAEAGDLVVRRLACALGGVALTFAFWTALRRLRAAPLWVQAAAALAGAVPVTVAFATLNWWLFYGVAPPRSIAADVARWGYWRVLRYTVVDSSVSWLFFFAGGALFLLMLQYAMGAAANARRAAEAERAAHVAELRALRYQLNPHFLFNSLNALSCLVLEHRVRDADRMILELSALLRRILDVRPDEAAPLEDEFELQRLYLALESRRFGERLTARLDLPDDLARVCVPPLLLQPLVENAVKHGVSRARGPVAVDVSARAEGSDLVLEVCDTGSGASGGEGAAGFGIGLSNVRERLSLRPGGGSLAAGPRPGGGYLASIRLPRALADA